MTAPLAWLIDTNVISEMMRPRPEPRVAAFLDSIAEDGLGIASITVWEILNGIGRLDPGRRRRILADRFQDLVDDLFEDRIVDWTSDDARACANIMSVGFGNPVSSYHGTLTRFDGCPWFHLFHPRRFLDAFCTG